MNGEAGVSAARSSLVKKALGERKIMSTARAAVGAKCGKESGFSPGAAPGGSLGWRTNVSDERQAAFRGAKAQLAVQTQRRFVGLVDCEGK